jgi:hypothetical protein
VCILFFLHFPLLSLSLSFSLSSFSLFLTRNKWVWYLDLGQCQVWDYSATLDGHSYFTKPWRWAELLNRSNNWVQSILLWHGWGQELLQTGLYFHLIYIKSLITFQCSEWSYGCILTS